MKKSHPVLDTDVKVEKDNFVDGNGNSVNEYGVHLFILF